MTFKVLIAAVVLTGPVVFIGVPAAQADPLSPAEVNYLNDVRHAIQISQDTPDQAKGDAELVSEGHIACHDRVSGQSASARPASVR